MTSSRAAGVLTRVAHAPVGVIVDRDPNPNPTTTSTRVVVVVVVVAVVAWTPAMSVGAPMRRIKVPAATASSPAPLRG